MPLYRLDIEDGDTLWITAHDERGAIDLACAHVVGEASLDGNAVVRLIQDADEALVLRATASHWRAAGGNDAGPAR